MPGTREFSGGFSHPDLSGPGGRHRGPRTRDDDTAAEDVPSSPDSLPDVRPLPKPAGSVQAELVPFGVLHDDVPSADTPGSCRWTRVAPRAVSRSASCSQRSSARHPRLPGRPVRRDGGSRCLSPRAPSGRRGAAQHGRGSSPPVVVAVLPRHTPGPQGLLPRRIRRRRGLFRHTQDLCPEHAECGRVTAVERHLHLSGCHASHPCGRCLLGSLETATRRTRRPRLGAPRSGSTPRSAGAPPRPADVSHHSRVVGVAQEPLVGLLPAGASSTPTTSCPRKAKIFSWTFATRSPSHGRSGQAPGLAKA